MEYAADEMNSHAGEPTTCSSGGGGADTLDGGAGTDMASYAVFSAGVTINLSLGLGGAGGNPGIDTLISV